MTRSTLVLLSAIAAGAALTGDGSSAWAQGGRVLNVGGASVVVSRPTGRYQMAQAPKAGAVPRFRSLSPQARSAATAAALEAVQAAAPGAAVNKLTELPGGVTLVATRATRVPPASAVRNAGDRLTFRPLARPARDAILQAATAESGTTATPVATPAEAPFTLTAEAMHAPGKASVFFDQPRYINGAGAQVAFAGSTGSVSIYNANSKSKQFMLHFQLFSNSVLDYEINSCDGTTTKVRTQTANSVRDIVVFCMLPEGQVAVSLATVKGGPALWYFIGVEVTAM